MRRVLCFAAALVGLLAGCTAPLDSEQLRICRLALPGLHPPATDIREVRIGPAALGHGGVRIDYAAREPGETARPHWAACGFGGTAFERDRRELVAVETDTGALGEARLLYLKRFWLPEAGTLDDAAPAVPVIAAPVAYAAQQLVNALALCAVYAVLATAYALIYGLTGRLNLAFGEIAVVGAYGAIGGLAAGLALGLDNPFVGLAIAFVIAAGLSSLWSWLVGRTIVAPLHGRSSRVQPILVATIALAVAIQEFLRLFQGVREHWLPPLFNTPIPLARAGGFVVTVTPMQLAIAALALAASVGVLWLLARSRFGRHWRAFADDPGAAALFGVDGNRLMATTFALAGLMTGLAGWIVAAYYGNVSASMGTMLGLKALVAAVVGGIGSVPGAFLGGILVGLIEAGWSAYFDITLRDIVVYAILIAVFVLRPGGLLGFAGPRPRQV